MITRCPACGVRTASPSPGGGTRRPSAESARRPFVRPRYPDRPVRISDTVYAREVIDFAGPVLAEFFSPHCGHCVRLAPVIDELAAHYAGRVKFVLIDIEHEQTVASQQKVEGTPTMLFYKNGRLVDRAVGALPKDELARRLDSLIAA